MTDYTPTKPELLEKWFKIKNTEPFTLDEIAEVIAEATHIGEEIGGRREQERIINHLMRRGMIKGTMVSKHFYPDDPEGMYLISGHKTSQWIYETDENKNIINFFPAGTEKDKDNELQ